MDLIKWTVRSCIVGLVCLVSLLASPPIQAADSSHGSSTPGAPQVELYVTSWCPYCEKAQTFFQQRGIAYTLYDIERDPQAAQRKQMLAPGVGVPVAVINGTKISGWSRRLYETALEN